jgi:charged multivesicular body protein 5
VENLHDEMSDLMDMSEEVNAALSASYAVPDGLDEDELLGELDALDDQVELGESESVPDYLVSAQVPKDKPRLAEPSKEELEDSLGLPRSAASLKI